MKAQTYTYSHMEAACCIWEWMIERNMENEKPEWLGFFGGAAAHRGVAIDLAESMDIAYRYAVSRYGYDDSFDWEFVPMILNAITTLSGFTNDPGALVDQCLGEGP